MKKYLIVALLASLLAGCAHDSPCVPVYDSQGRLVHTNTCMKGTTEDNWETAARRRGAAAVAGLTFRDRRTDPLDRFPKPQIQVYPLYLLHSIPQSKRSFRLFLTIVRQLS